MTGSNDIAMILEKYRKNIPTLALLYGVYLPIDLSEIHGQSVWPAYRKTGGLSTHYVSKLTDGRGRYCWFEIPLQADENDVKSALVYSVKKFCKSFDENRMRDFTNFGDVQ